MRSKLGEVEIGTGSVANIHALPELALAPESVKDDGVDGDGDGLDNDLDDAADEGPFLETADESIADVVLEELSSFVVFAAPAPDILATAVVPAVVEDGGAYRPHDDAEGEEEDGKDSVVDGRFLGALVPSSPIGVKDSQGEDKRDTGDDQE